MIKKAVIVAAGLSSRLYPLTLERPKCLLKVCDEEILLRNISLLKKHGIEEIYIVVGYRKNDIIEAVKDDAVCIFNPYYKYCNNMGSLWFTKFFIKNGSFIYMHADVLFSEKLFKDFLFESRSSDAIIDLAVEFKKADEEAMKVKVTNNYFLVESNKELSEEESAGEWTGLAVIKKPNLLYESIDNLLYEEKFTVYDTSAFTSMSKGGEKIKCISTGKEPWIEIDFLEDYEKAKELFS